MCKKETDVRFVAGQEDFYVILDFAEYILENWRMPENYLVLKNRLGKNT
jgi:hypothetical protein